jgi:hypothetical protein
VGDTSMAVLLKKHLINKEKIPVKLKFLSPTNAPLY